jgi:hypothetical protein
MMLTTSKFRSCVVAAGPGPGPVATNAAVGIGKRMPCQPLGPPPAHLLARRISTSEVPSGAIATPKSVPERMCKRLRECGIKWDSVGGITD